MPENRVTVVARPVGDIDRRLFGSFVEHLGRCVYDGIYEPGHPQADLNGFREDVKALVRELGVTTIRYPGGNFVSGYRWEDGVGPRAQRPVRLDLAWHSTESNEVGLHEFADWNEQIGSELMLAVNLGTRGPLEALDLLEYSNLRVGTRLSDLRAANGRVVPFDVRMWCLGNEMDGPWQLGHLDADDYGKLAARTAAALKQFDPGLELVVCGSSGSYMPTFGSWERTVLEHAYEHVEYISAHAYYQERDGDTASFLASAIDMDGFIDTVVAAADHVKSVKRSTRTVNISFDEWNVWDIDRFEQQDKLTDPNDWPTAPRLLEDSYTVTDAVVVGSLLICLLRHADRVKAASLAQLVNVIAPIMTEPGGPAWRQTTFFPFSITARLARGVVLEADITAAALDTTRFGAVSSVDAVITHDEHSRRASVLLVHRGLDAPTTVTVDLTVLNPVAILERHTLHDADGSAANTLQQPERVRPSEQVHARLQDGLLTIELAPVSWTALSIELR